MTAEATAFSTRYRETVKTARYHLAGTEPSVARHICFALHGYGQLASRFLQSFREIIPDGMCVVAPEALNRFYTTPLSRDGSHLERVGATWLTREDRDHEIADAIRWLDAVHEEVLHDAGSPPVVSVLGFSQGVATSMRWILNGNVRPHHFVIWSGGLAADLDLAEFGTRVTATNIVVVAGTKDEMMTTEQVNQLRRQFMDVGIAHSLRTHEGGHRLDSALLASLLHQLSAPSVR